MNEHLTKRNDRYFINKNTESFKVHLKGLAVIEICPSETCTRKCGFCPRADEKVYSNKPFYMSMDTITNIASKCALEKYNGDFHISGFGEPLLHKNIVDFIIVLKKYLPNRVALTTNGDLLTKEIIKKLFNAGLNYLIVSCYDGPERKSILNNFLVESDIKEQFYEIRELWYHNDETLEGFADRNNFNNRSGAATKLDFKPKKGQCYLPFYKLVFDWNGDALLCCNDWLRKSKGYGNINLSSLKDIWYSDAFTKVRNNLYAGERVDPACSGCSIKGTLIGAESVSILLKNS